jgi:hypothetical protein
MRVYHNSTTGQEEVVTDPEPDGISIFAIYLCPILLYFLNYIFIPFLVIKLTFYENNFKFSQREFSILNKNYIYMVFGTVFMPGLSYTITLRFV